MSYYDPVSTLSQQPASLGYGRGVPLGEAVEDRIVEAMKGHGFNASEARIYVALLKNHPATGYELAARSGVPRSAIYTVLKKLHGLGLVNAIQEKPAKYVPLSPDQLFALLEARFSKSLTALRTSIDDLGGASLEAVTWTVQGYPAMIEQAETLIRNASRSVYGSLWKREAGRLDAPLREAMSAGVEVVLFSWNALPADLGTVFAYGIEEADLSPHWEHKIILVADDRRILAGGAEETEENRAVITEEVALVEMAVSNLVLDITLFGQRQGVDTGAVVTRLTRHLAPVEELIEARS